MPTYVQIARNTVKEVFDSKHKEQLLRSAEQAMRAAIKVPLTSTKPTDGSRGYSLELESSLTLDAKAKKLHGKCDVLVNIWPKDILHKKVMGKGTLDVDPAKVDKGDVTAVIDATMKGAVSTALTILKTPPP